MKIYGIGTDIVSIIRIKKLINKKIFLKRLFGKEEVVRCSKLTNPHNCFAKRFAAKEAFSKALGTGISNGINLNEIVILNKKSGKPYISIIGQTKKTLKKKFKNKNSKISLSLSDEKKYAVAFVTISLWLRIIFRIWYMIILKLY